MPVLQCLGAAERPPGTRCDGDLFITPHSKQRYVRLYGLRLLIFGLDCSIYAVLVYD